jgi:hypothetical protein
VRVLWYTKIAEIAATADDAAHTTNVDAIPVNFLTRDSEFHHCYIINKYKYKYMNSRSTQEEKYRSPEARKSEYTSSHTTMVDILLCFRTPRI